MSTPTTKQTMDALHALIEAASDGSLVALLRRTDEHDVALSKIITFLRGPEPDSERALNTAESAIAAARQPAPEPSADANSCPHSPFTRCLACVASDHRAEPSAVDSILGTMAEEARVVTLEPRGSTPTGVIYGPPDTYGRRMGAAGGTNDLAEVPTAGQAEPVLDYAEEYCPKCGHAFHSAELALARKASKSIAEIRDAQAEQIRILRACVEVAES